MRFIMIGLCSILSFAYCTANAEHFLEFGCMNKALAWKEYAPSECQAFYESQFQDNGCKISAIQCENGTAGTAGEKSVKCSAVSTNCSTDGIERGGVRNCLEGETLQSLGYGFIDSLAFDYSYDFYPLSTCKSSVEETDSSEH